MRRSHFILRLALVLFVPGCAREGAETNAEAELEAPSTGQVNLTQDAEELIGLQTTIVKSQPVVDTISTVAWLLVKPGNEVQIKAVATGFVTLDDHSEQVSLGNDVDERQELGKLHIFLSPQEEAQLVALKEDTDILIEQSLASLAVAEDRYKKVKELEGGALSGRELHALQELVARSKAAIEEARDKLPFLPPEPYQRPLRLEDVSIHTPMSGRIMAVHVRPRQLVVQGDPLWTVSDWSTLWVKVPVFEGDLSKVDQSRAIAVNVPGWTKQLQAQPTGIPQATGRQRRSVDVFYEVSNNDWQLRPGQAVSVTIPTSSASARLVIPTSALLWDGMSNAWVYVREGNGTFRRRRVQIGSEQDGNIVVERGLGEGDQVVVVGAETLFGEEFQSQIEVEDDD